MDCDCRMSYERRLLTLIKRQLSETEMRWLMERLTIYLAAAGRPRTAVFNRPEISITPGSKKK